MFGLRLEKPVSYTMNVAPDGRRGVIKLEFRRTYIKRNIGIGVDGYTYSFNGRTYRDVESFLFEPAEDLSEDVSITTDAYGAKVLKTYTQIPTFDSSDREWDSRELEFLFFDGRNVHLVVMRGGYRIAKLTFYEKLLSADASLEPVFHKLGWPTKKITWV